MGSRTYRHVLSPSVDCLREQGKLLIDTKGLAEFLGVERKIIQQLIYCDRIPLPVSLGLAEIHRWSVIELLEWVEAGCPRRTKWIEARGQSGWYPHWRTRP